jgi:hypothetical protein
MKTVPDFVDDVWIRRSKKLQGDAHPVYYEGLKSENYFQWVQTLIYLYVQS